MSVPIVAFGTYNEFGVPTDTTATIGVKCVRVGGPATVAVTVGIGPSGNNGSIANRVLAGGSPTFNLQYNLYQDAARSAVWGQTNGVDTVSGNITIPNISSNTISFTIYGRIAANQNPRVGSYSDLLSITVSP